MPNDLHLQVLLFEKRSNIGFDTSHSVHKINFHPIGVIWVFWLLISFFLLFHLFLRLARIFFGIILWYFLNFHLTFWLLFHLLISLYLHLFCVLLLFYLLISHHTECIKFIKSCFAHCRRHTGIEILKPSRTIVVKCFDFLLFLFGLLLLFIFHFYRGWRGCLIFRFRVIHGWNLPKLNTIEEWLWAFLIFLLSLRNFNLYWVFFEDRIKKFNSWAIIIGRSYFFCLFFLKRLTHQLRRLLYLWRLLHFST